MTSALPDSEESPLELKTDSGSEIVLTPQAQRGLDRLAAVLKEPGPVSCALLVDDDRMDAELIRHAFKIVDDTIRVEVVDDGLKAIDYLEGHHDFSDRTRFPLPRIILLDLYLPRANGIHVLKHIRSTPHLKDSLVITLTGLDDQGNADEVRRLGVSAYIKKPRSFENLVGIVRGLRTSGLV
jgi:CheY-like chemotaxis protein